MREELTFNNDLKGVMALTAYLSRLKISSFNQTALIEGKCEKRVTEGYLLLEERIKGNDLFIPRDVHIPCRVKHGAFRADLDLSLLCDLKSDMDLWDCFFVLGGEKLPVAFPPKGDKKYSVSVRLLTIVFYQNSNRNLSVSVKNNAAFKASLHSFSGDSGNYRLEGELEGMDRRLIQSACLAIRKRDNKNSIQYKHESTAPLDFDSGNRWTASLDKQSIFPDSSIRHEEVWDLFIKLENSQDAGILYLPLRNQAAFDDGYTVMTQNIFYQAKFYVNKKNCVGLWVKRVPRYFELKNVTFNVSGQLDVLCSHSEHEKIIEARLELNDDKWAEHFDGFSFEGSVAKRLKTTGLSFPLARLKDLYKIEKNDRFAVTILIEDIKTSARTWMPLFIKDDQLIETIKADLSDELAALVKTTPQHEVEVVITDRMSTVFHHKEPVKLAILGTCYTRGAFNSAPYFNPGYKEKYTITFTQFHSSIPSLMSEPVHFPESFFKDRKPIEKAYLACDFDKLFFDRLSESKADYFMFDLYPDAVRDLVVYNDQHMITGSFYLRNRDFLQSLTGKARFISHDDEKEFLNYWCPAADAFAAKIVQFFPQERIILQKARMINRYYDTNHQVKYFGDQLDLVKRSNMFFQFMESYLLHRLPHIHTIDLNDFGYIGRYDHPYGLSTNHYEPDYYKRLMQELDQIVNEQDKENLARQNL